MSAPKVGVWKSPHSVWWWWQCGAGPACPAKYSFDFERTLSAAADAGRAHLAQFHTAQMPQVAHGDPEPAHVAPGPHTARPGHDWSFPCCTTPMQHAHTHSREDC